MKPPIPATGLHHRAPVAITEDPTAPRVSPAWAPSPT